MSNILDWIKANPFAVGCGVVIVIAAAAFYFPIHTSGAAFRDEMAQRDSEIRSIGQLQRTRKEIPPAQPDEPVQSVTLTVNDAAIQRLESIYTSMETEYRNVFNAAVTHNQAGHAVMLEGLFPKWATTDANKPYDAIDAYLRSFDVLYKSLNAGTPPSEADIAAEFKQIETRYRATILQPQSQLSPDQQLELHRRQALALDRMYKERADKFHLYAAPYLFDLAARTWSPGPFQVNQLSATPGAAPLPEAIWEGQMQLWIQQDIVQAIRMVNQCDTPGLSLTRLPIKRLLSIAVDPKYIGVPDTGLTGQTPPELQDTNKRLPDNFAASPTGRRCNPLYDVRHATVSMIVDSRDIAKILEAFGRVNLMTVINVNVRAVDVVEHFRAGYYYAKVPAVQLDLTLETIWLRQWTAGHASEAEAKNAGEQYFAGLMPDAVRIHLGLAPREGRAPTPANTNPTDETTDNP